MIGTITEQHVKEIAEVYGTEVAEAVRCAKPGQSFLEILVQLGKI